MHRAARQYSDQMYCSHCERTWDVNDVDPPECEVYLSPDSADAFAYAVRAFNNPSEPVTLKRYGDAKVNMNLSKGAAVALVGFLAAKLALYEPDCPTVKEALEWLRDANSK